jgi:hydrogenase maturation protein HypF
MEFRNLKIWSIEVIGVVQSVGFRPSVVKFANKYNFSGAIQNNGSSGVLIYLLGSSDTLNHFIEKLKENKPHLSQIYEIRYHELDSNTKVPVKLEINQFTIIPSQSSQDINDFAPLPSDISICTECTSETINPSEHRYNYPFNSCTNCGPRTTVIISMPYDRENTSFEKFKLCDFCNRQYSDINDRRYHAQTIACQNCGPRYFSHNIVQGKTKTKSLNFKELAKKIDNQEAVIIQSPSGTQLIGNALSEVLIQNLRKTKRKGKNKPFAVMMKDIDTVRKYCKLSTLDETLLNSDRKPILLLEIRSEYIETFKQNQIIINLVELGVVLPYTGFHQLLFSHIKTDVIVFTSANRPGLPMPIQADDVLNLEMPDVETYITHNLPTIQRLDDSVIRSFSQTYRIIRRARGFTPEPLFIKSTKNDMQALSFGAIENNTNAFKKNSWLMSTQHHGHIENKENLDFSKQAVEKFIDLYKFKPAKLIIDKHPELLQRSLLDYYLEKFNLDQNDVIEVQHHMAHALSLLADNDTFDKDMLIWSVDGYGYGNDGQAWGTELFLYKDGSLERISSAYPISYVGGDMNAIYPNRMLLHYLKSINYDVDSIFDDDRISSLNHGISEYKFLKQAPYTDKNYTSSVARLLDAVSALLNISSKRTYRGEPAITLEAAAHKITIDHTISPFVIEHQGSLKVDTKEIFQKVIELFSDGIIKSKIAAYTQDAVGVSLTAIIKHYLEELSIKNYGFTGGVAYNKRIDSIMNYSKLSNTKYYHHKNIPPGDGGISVGQLGYLYTKNYEE